MHIDDFNSLKDKLEPEASAGGTENNEWLILSIAVSAKRIADELDQIVGTLDQVSDGNSYAAINTRSTK